VGRQIHPPSERETRHRRDDPEASRDALEVVALMKGECIAYGPGDETHQLKREEQLSNMAGFAPGFSEHDGEYRRPEKRNWQ
jgi:hypothetical protein